MTVLYIRCTSLEINELYSPSLRLLLYEKKKRSLGMRLGMNISDSPSPDFVIQFWHDSAII